MKDICLKLCQIYFTGNRNVYVVNIVRFSKHCYLCIENKPY